MVKCHICSVLIRARHAETKPMTFCLKTNHQRYPTNLSIKQFCDMAKKEKKKEKNTRTQYFLLPAALSGGIVGSP